MFFLQLQQDTMRELESGLTTNPQQQDAGIGNQKLTGNIKSLSAQKVNVN
jgi:hypothetical protein